MKRLLIPIKFPSLNESMRGKSNHGKISNRYKQKMQKQITPYLPPCKLHLSYPLKIKFTWIEKIANRDIDNIGFAKKYILDAMVNAGIIENDSPKYIRAVSDEHVSINQIDKEMLDSNLAVRLWGKKGDKDNENRGYAVIVSIYEYEPSEALCRNLRDILEEKNLKRRKNNEQI